MGAIVLDLRLGLLIEPFSLGMPICEAFAQIDQQPNIYDVVLMNYFDEEPLKLDIVISFPDHGFHHRFVPWSQGLSFAFPIPSQYTDCCHDGKAELPLEFPDGTTPVTFRVSIGSTDSKVGVGSLMDKASAPPLPAGSLYMEEVLVKLGEELWFAVGRAAHPVWCIATSRVVDQMVTLCGDYFCNYFTRGLDILFDGKLVAHLIMK